MATDRSLGYDELPYPSSPYPYTHCDHLAMVGRLFGMPTADVRRCRVLEVGCADGANLIPMAMSLPESEFVGIDLSQRQIASGQELIERLELSNVQLRQQDLTELAADASPFDYVIAHGVFSWTARPVQESLLALCRRSLDRHGVAFVSYNVYPGWQQRKMLREWLLEATAAATNTAARLTQARQLLSSLGKSLTSSDETPVQELCRLIHRIEGWSDGYLRHDLLEDTNEPQFFADFVHRVETHGLKFFAEADVGSMVGAGVDSQLVAAAQRWGGSEVGREQLLDLLAQREFRQSLLCHEECSVGQQLRSEVLEQAYVVSALRRVDRRTSSGALAEFRSPHGMVYPVRDRRLVATLELLEASWPAGRWFSDLARDLASRPDQDVSSVLVNFLLAGFVDRGIELRTVEPAIAHRVSSQPTASRLARVQAESSMLVTNLKHDVVKLEPHERTVIQLLDGTRDRSSLVESFAEGAEEEPIEPLLEKVLERFRRQSLLTA